MTDTPHEWCQDKGRQMYDDDRGFRCRSPEHADCDAELSYEVVLKRLQATDILSAEVSRRAGARLNKGAALGGGGGEDGWALLVYSAVLRGSGISSSKKR